MTDETASLCNRAGCISSVCCYHHCITLIWNSMLLMWQQGQKTNGGIVITEHFILLCYALCSSVLCKAYLIPGCAAVNKHLLLGSDGRFPVWLGDGVIADLVAVQSNIPCALSKAEFWLTFLLDNCKEILYEPCLSCFWVHQKMLWHRIIHAVNISNLKKGKDYLPQGGPWLVLSWLFSLNIWSCFQSRKRNSIITLSAWTSLSLQSFLFVFDKLSTGGCSNPKTHMIVLLKGCRKKVPECSAAL